MAEPVKNGKVSLRQILDEIADDEVFSEKERQQARDESLDLEFQEWKKAQKPDIMRLGDKNAKI